MSRWQIGQIKICLSHHEEQMSDWGENDVEFSICHCGSVYSCVWLTVVTTIDYKHSVWEAKDLFWGKQGFDK